MRWPRGKYNGRQIEGLQVSVAVHLLTWFWRPRFSWNFGEPYIVWLCVNVRAKSATVNRGSKAVSEKPETWTQLKTWTQLIDGEAVCMVRYEEYARLRSELEKIAVHPAEREERKHGESWLGLSYRSCAIARDALGMQPVQTGDDRGASTERARRIGFH